MQRERVQRCIHVFKEKVTPLIVLSPSLFSIKCSSPSPSLLNVALPSFPIFLPLFLWSRSPSIYPLTLHLPNYQLSLLLALFTIKISSSFDHWPAAQYSSRVLIFTFPYLLFLSLSIPHSLSLLLSIPLSLTISISLGSLYLSLGSSQLYKVH